MSQRRDEYRQLLHQQLQLIQEAHAAAAAPILAELARLQAMETAPALLLRLENAQQLPEHLRAQVREFLEH